MKKQHQRILVVGPAWIGDMVMAQSLFMTLKQRNPEVMIDVLAPAWSLPLLARMPEVNEAITLPAGHGEFALGKRFRTGWQLRGNAYTQAIVIPRSYKAALVPFFAGIPQRTGYRGEMRYGMINDMRVLDKNVLTQTVQRQVALGLPESAELPPAIPYPKLETDTHNQKQLIEKLALVLDKPIVGLMPGAEYGPAKQWPVGHFAELARLLVGEGYQVWVFGSTKEAAMGDQIARSVRAGVYNLCGKTDLVDVLDLIACAEQVVSNDSGLMHVAAAMDVRVNVVYGSSTPDYTPPLSDSAEIFFERLSCSPCFERTCRYGHYKCLKNITPLEVYERMQIN